MAVSANIRGFTLIELLIVLTIISILAGVVILSIGGTIGTARKTAYISVKEQMKRAVISYAINSLGDYPLTGNTTVIDGKTLGIIDVCALLLRNNPTGLFGDMPDGCISYPNNDNCESQVYNCSCNVEAHYIWAIDVNGNIYSSCVDTVSNKGGCKNTSSDGFQDAWP
jgi:prepilin-type N-terminal cleavage/methylation domain-containing protein